VRRIRFCHTPKFDSWPNIAENELSSLTRQCTEHRRHPTSPRSISEPVKSMTGLFKTWAARVGVVPREENVKQMKLPVEAGTTNREMIS
jgi:hypothetical protein